MARNTGFDCVAMITCMFALTFVLSGCGASTSTPEPSDTSPSPTPTIIEESTPMSEPTPDAPTPVVPDPDDTDELPRPVRLALEAAVEVVEADPDSVRVVSFQERDWPSTALGCPQPGFSYAQVVTPGYFVLIQAPDTTLEYHTNMGTNVILCETSSD